MKQWLKKILIFQQKTNNNNNKNKIHNQYKTQN